MRRVYLPTTLAGLAAAHAGGVLVGPLPAHGVTAAVREWYTEGDLEELEYVALTEAAEASLRLLAVAPDVARRRVVVAADVDETEVRDVDDARFRSAVLVSCDIPVSGVASVHVDEADAVPTVAAAVDAIPAADAGDDDARFTLDEAEATELLWYDVSELGDLV
jgi:hypothetical protein